MTTRIVTILAGVALTIVLARHARRSESRGRARRLRPSVLTLPPRVRASLAFHRPLATLGTRLG